MKKDNDGEHGGGSRGAGDGDNSADAGAGKEEGDVAVTPREEMSIKALTKRLKGGNWTGEPKTEKPGKEREGVPPPEGGNRIEPAPWGQRTPPTTPRAGRPPDPRSRSSTAG